MDLEWKPKSNRYMRDEFCLIWSHFDGQPEHGRAYGRQFSCVLIVFIKRRTSPCFISTQVHFAKDKCSMERRGGVNWSVIAFSRGRTFTQMSSHMHLLCYTYTYVQVICTNCIFNNFIRISVHLSYLLNFVQFGRIKLHSVSENGLFRDCGYAFYQSQCVCL